MATGKYVYQCLQGYFSHDNPLDARVDPLPARFGLLDDSPQRWARFRNRIKALQDTSAPDAQIKVFWLGRHGEGYHNVAEAKYGTKAWDDHWSKLNGDEEITWGPDPELTATGKGQAVAAHQLWTAELSHGVPLPQKLYTSPLTRAMHTHCLTFEGMIDFKESRTVVVEGCREENGVHTCDRRRSKSYIRERFPDFEIEPGFTDDDNLWDAEVRETHAQVDARARAVVDRIFDMAPKDTFISITAHGGWINGFQRSLGHPLVVLPTGGILPVVVCATKLRAEER